MIAYIAYVKSRNELKFEVTNLLLVPKFWINVDLSYMFRWRSYEQYIDSQFKKPLEAQLRMVDLTDTWLFDIKATLIDSS